MAKVMEYLPDGDYDEEQDEICHKETVAKVGSIAIPVFFITVIILSLVGNILVLVILGLYETLKSLTNVFILNLAVSDLMFTAGLPFWTWYYVWGWTLPDAVCTGVNFVFAAGFYSSVVFLMLMTVQRYMAVVHPLSDWETGQKFVILVIVMFAWVLSIGAALPALLLSSVLPDPEDSNKFYCEYSSVNATLGITYEQNAFLATAFVIMAFCYTHILQTVYKSPRKQRLRTVRLILCIVAVFFLGWAPYNLVIFLKSFSFFQISPFTDCHVSDSLEYAFYVCKLLAFSHCCLNPVLYVFVGVKFRNHLKTILRKFLFRDPSETDPQQKRITAVQGSQGSLY